MDKKTAILIGFAMILTFSMVLVILEVPQALGPSQTKTVYITEYKPKLHLTYSDPWGNLNDSTKNDEIKQILKECDRVGLDSNQACSQELDMFKNWCIYKYSAMPVCVDVLRR